MDPSTYLSQNTQLPTVISRRFGTGLDRSQIICTKYSWASVTGRVRFGPNSLIETLKQTQTQDIKREHTGFIEVWR